MTLRIPEKQQVTTTQSIVWRTWMHAQSARVMEHLRKCQSLKIDLNVAAKGQLTSRLNRSVRILLLKSQSLKASWRTMIKNHRRIS